MLYCILVIANLCFSSILVCTLPNVCGSFSSRKKLNNPIKMERTDHRGLHNSGWKSLILVQILWLIWKRPLGVHMYIDGGLYGYCGLNTSLPWYIPSQKLGLCSSVRSCITKCHSKMLSSLGAHTMFGISSLCICMYSFCSLMIHCCGMCVVVFLVMLHPLVVVLLLFFRVFLLKTFIVVVGSFPSENWQYYYTSSAICMKLFLMNLLFE